MKTREAGKEEGNGKDNKGNCNGKEGGGGKEDGNGFFSSFDF